MLSKRVCSTLNMSIQKRQRQLLSRFIMHFWKSGDRISLMYLMLRIFRMWLSKNWWKPDFIRLLRTISFIEKKEPKKGKEISSKKGSHWNLMNIQNYWNMWMRLGILIGFILSLILPQMYRISKLMWLMLREMHLKIRCLPLRRLK